jgi:hypothetical protein
MSGDTLMHDLDAAVSYWIHIVGSGIEIFGVLVIVLGIGWATFLYVHQRMPRRTTRPTKSALAVPSCSA